MAMLNPQIQQSNNSSNLSFLRRKMPFLHGTSNICFPVSSRPNKNKKAQDGNKIKAEIRNTPAEIPTLEATKAVKAIVTVKRFTLSGLTSGFGFGAVRDGVTDLFGKAFLLELVSAELDPTTGLEKLLQGYARRAKRLKNEVKYVLQFKVPESFGEVAGILVENEHHKEIFLQDVALDGLPNGPITIACESWIHSKYDNPRKRVFFTNKSYLPSQTPSGLKKLREEELKVLQGFYYNRNHGDNNDKKYEKYERIYDYDMYNDLGEERPVLGGKEHPYPRRCRTRPRVQGQDESDQSHEPRSIGNFYVPRDEVFSDIKELTFGFNTIASFVHALIPSIDAVFDSDLGFSDFTDIDSMYTRGHKVPSLGNQSFLKALPRLVEALEDEKDFLLRFELPEAVKRDHFVWLNDKEFARQTLAGTNPYSIQLVTEWPLKSKLDPEIYGPPESAITTEIIESEIKGIMSVGEAIKQKKLYIMDFHDLLLPYVEKVRQLKGTTLYGSRTLFFLDQDGTLRPLAIELRRPPMNGKPHWKQVFKPSGHSTDGWLWRLAKTHVLAHDSAHHQLISHWLRTHCVVEPFIIATNRRLSAMHPIYKLLHPHFRFTMEINAQARKILINADGILENTFSLGKYTMELSSVVYDQQWRFDSQALPADLIMRGMAVKDETAPHGLRLAIEDYPFANDGLLIWDAIKEWITDYVSHYYTDQNFVQNDGELQAWWTEIRTVGHADKKDEPWWPQLKTPQDLIDIVTTIAWVASCHHAAVNFGQYTYGGYFPSRPTIARTAMPTEDPTDQGWKAFLNKPEDALLRCFPSEVQATKFTVVLDVLSHHSPDEEYLGEKMEPSWSVEPTIKAAFDRFSGRLKEIEDIIDKRNANAELKNRNGAGIVPYELLKPFSEPGVTGKGVPYSISI